MDTATLVSQPEFYATWWVWASAALGLAVLEVLLPGFLFLGFAIGAGVLALLLLGLGAFATLPALLLIFAVLSLVAWLGLRRMFTLPGTQVKTFDRDIND